MLTTNGIVSMSLYVLCMIMMGLLLVGTYIKKYKTSSNRILTFMIVAQILNLMVAIFQWIVLGNLSFLTIYKWSFTIIFLLTASILAGIHMYILYVIRERMFLAEIKWEMPKGLIIYPIVVNVINTVIFASSIWTGFIYEFDAMGYEHFSNNYYILDLMVLVVFLPDIYILFKNRKVIDTSGIFFMFIYWIIPVAAFPTNVYLDFDATLISLSLFILVIFISIDIRQSEMILEQKAEIIEKEKVANDGRTYLLLSQIQPHFIFNTLNTIRYLVSKDPKKAADAIEKFSKYLRYSMNSYQKSETVPFESELETVENYIFLEKERFGERLNVTYDIRDFDFEVPALCVQTIVENAVKHGVTQKIEGGTVNISSCGTGDGYNIVIEDDGVGFDPDKEPEDDRVHVGLKNTSERLFIMTGGSLFVESEVGKGSKITMWIPKKRSGEE